MKNLLTAAFALLACCLMTTSCLKNNSDDIKPIDWPTNDSVITVKVMQNPTHLCVAGNYLMVNGYGSDDWYTPGALTYPVQRVDPTTLMVTNVPDVKATNFVGYAGLVLMYYSATEDYVNYDTKFQYYDPETEDTAAFLLNAPDELTNSNVYMMSVNPNNGHLYIGTTDNFSKSVVYHFGDLYNGFPYMDKIEGLGPSVGHAAYFYSDVCLLSEGTYQGNNSKLYKVKGATTTPVEMYSSANDGKIIGDTGNDLINYNGNLYMVVNGSKYIARLEENGKEVARYTCTAADGEPRFITEYGNHLYVSTYSGKVLRLTPDMKKDGELDLKTALEDIVVCADRICVLGCAMGADNRLFIINPSKFPSVK